MNEDTKLELKGLSAFKTMSYDIESIKVKIDSLYKERDNFSFDYRKKLNVHQNKINLHLAEQDRLIKESKK